MKTNNDLRAFRIGGLTLLQLMAIFSVLGVILMVLVNYMH